LKTRVELVAEAGLNGYRGWLSFVDVVEALGLRLANTSGRNLTDYALAAGCLTFSAGAGVPALADSMAPIFSRVGSVLMEGFFFLFLNA
jgi:hypothetical protein